MSKDSYNLPNISRAHWHKPHHGEPRWPVMFVVGIVIVLQLLLPKSLSLKTQPYFCALEAIMGIALLIINPGRISQHKVSTRSLGIALTLVMSASNIASAVHLIEKLIDGTIKSATSLLAFGGSVWLCNVVIFSLWYWEFDRQGPGARATALDPYPDFLFPQMTANEFAKPEWTPNYIDYLYTSFTNASAFSPTDVLPLSKWAKMLMMVQSALSLVTVGLVIARAVNILN
jgi:uncharacterized membrane protein